MKNESILYGVIGLLAGVVIAGFTASYAVNNNNNGIMRMMGMNRNSQVMMADEDMTMSQMSAMLKNKTGDDFDEAFINGMIVHHQGAIDMASLAKQNAKHDEIKQMADDIISAQSKEIEMMQNWQKSWGYSDSQMMNMEH